MHGAIKEHRSVAELLLALFTGREQATVIYGDLIEMAATRGHLWFAAAYARTLISLSWRILVALFVAEIARQFLFDLFHLYMRNSPAVWRNATRILRQRAQFVRSTAGVYYVDTLVRLAIRRCSLRSPRSLRPPHRCRNDRHDHRLPRYPLDIAHRSHSHARPRLCRFPFQTMAQVDRSAGLDWGGWTY